MSHSVAKKRTLDRIPLNTWSFKRQRKISRRQLRYCFPPNRPCYWKASECLRNALWLHPCLKYFPLLSPSRQMNLECCVDVTLLSHNSGDACELFFSFFFFSLVSSEESFRVDGSSRCCSVDVADSAAIVASSMASLRTSCRWTLGGSHTSWIHLADRCGIHAGRLRPSV